MKQQRKNRRDPGNPVHDIVWRVPSAYNRAERRAAGYRQGVPMFVNAMRLEAGRLPRRFRRQFARQLGIAE
jgi:hypothetical protein